ncbi:AAA family ATPase [Neiella marina]|uniref:DNA 3'-5' helicase II n=1 Tax=Neiella holothuriorum TaxID=2870530 RepID=A0ABS7ED95_9GAMM|nr:AAA family ATPase [Neiella holothuriorum]MBW8190314.1 AAA family ATPase [Neiella holothuriorum]
MSKRINELPQLHNLNETQQRVMRLPLEGLHLVVGAPGTGKSIVALLRMEKYQGKQKQPKVLTFNHVLAAYMAQLLSCDLDTAMSWMYQIQYGLTSEYMPEKQPSFGSKVKEVNPDYDQLKKIFRDHFKQVDIQDLIIDEGQDLPSGYYESLMELGFENFFVVGDQNQQITEDNSSRQDLETVLRLSPSDVIELDEIFRSTVEIVKLCQHFYTDRASPKPKLPKRPPSLLKPTLLNYSTVNACVETILRAADRDSGKLIGVIVSSETKREDYVKKLSQVDVPRDNEKPLISSYSSQQKQGSVNIDFGKGGIVVLCDKSVKGIEFDTVYVILDGLQVINGDEDSMRKRLYVMTSRAKYELFLMQSASFPNKPVEALLPADTNILERDSI